LQRYVFFFRQNGSTSLFVSLRLKQLCHKLGEPRWAATQAHRQDLATGRAKNQKEGTKTRKRGHIFKTQYWMYAATGGQT